MKFTPEQLEPKLYGTDVVQDLLIKHERWSVLHSLVFKHEGKFYRTTYRAPATEGQDCDTWDYQKEVECAEVVPLRRMMIRYEEVFGPSFSDTLEEIDHEIRDNFLSVEFDESRARGDFVEARRILDAVAEMIENSVEDIQVDPTEEAGSFTLKRGDDGLPYWSGGEPGDKEGRNFDPEQPLVLDPSAFRIGTVVTAEQPPLPHKQCSVCEGELDHHWMPHSADENDCRMVCQHCDASRAMTEAELDSDDS